MTAALVLFSGGQDSTICLLWALRNFTSVETVGFDYGQRHKVELQCRAAILKKMAAPNLGADHMLDIGVLGTISDTALTRESAIVMQENGLPSTFVPGRNLVFFTLAGALAYRRGITHLVGGMCETDFSGYPDCRADTLSSLQTTLSLGMDRTFTLHTPLMHISKATSWKLAEDMGGTDFVELVRTQTHSCYTGERGALHGWGYGCGACPACDLRRKGYEEYLSQPRPR
jgi:7-cyano-7-deazaguanine synthase